LLLHIVARGRIGQSPESELVDRYMKRIIWPTRVTELPDQGGRTPAVGPYTRHIVLDERGKQLGSKALPTCSASGATMASVRRVL